MTASTPHRARRLAGVATVAMTLTLVPVTSASAAPSQTIRGNAYGLQAAANPLGLSPVTVAPVPQASVGADGSHTHQSLATLDTASLGAPGVLHATGLHGDADGNPVSGETTAAGGVLSSYVGLGLGLETDLVQASCSANPGNHDGQTTLLGLEIGALGGAVPGVGVHPSPNQAITVPGVATVVLNEQITNPDGSLTVNAVAVHAPGLGLTNADIVLGSATCGPNTAAAGVPVGPGGWPVIVAGAGALGLVVRRVRRHAGRSTTVVASA